MVSFITKQLEVSSVGEKLKSLREKAGIDLDDLAKSIKIRAVYLQRLETNDYEKLPDEVYVGGFIKRYVLALRSLGEGGGVEPQSFVEEYKKEQRRFKKLSQPDLPFLKTPKFILTPRMISKILITLVILAIGGYFFYQASFLFSPPKITLLSPQADMVVKEDKLQFIGQVTPDAYLTINNQEAYIDKEGNFKEEIVLKSGLNIIELRAKNRLDKSASIIRKIIKE